MTATDELLAKTRDYLSFAAEMADAVRPLARSYFRTTLDIDTKLDESPVTVADRTIERTLRELIDARFPHHGIIGEEAGRKDGGDLTWVIDPIDGTKSFITGFPLFGTLIALAFLGEPLCGLIDIPAIDERWAALPGATLFNGESASTSSCRTMREARFYTTSPDIFTGREAEQFERLSRETKFRRFGGDCYMYGLLASGHVDLILERGLLPYDYMALVPVVTGAGGVITDWDGKPLTLQSTGRVLAAATPELHSRALEILDH
ncbi:histidinol-phosphatase [Bosea sp. (in: a-proteobacteria)]|uniref:histidinol-phosphatase n=1 Tax=Bosea sp. (in: a-proteobacteria) TaxID=1871050 RepID=UPI002629504B|nr:histidinol-phosphatase [Bosea sp. (in: a-proteobacteria)]MCO5093585.1 histidinol-phosphatase [Bosea sp. (in: a-proteobacteria)]